MIATALSLFSAALIPSPCPQQGETLLTIAGELTETAHGAAVAGLGDLDQDGTRDYAIAAPWGNSVMVYSGVDDSLLFKVYGSLSDGSEYGVALADAGDVNGDSVPDILLGQPVAGYRPEVDVLSGVDGSRIESFGWSSNTDFGRSTDGCGDLNGDGYDDIIVGAPRYSLGTGGYYQQCGSVHVYSGLGGSSLLRWDGTATGQYLGSSVAGVGDLDLDGVPDIAFGSGYLDSNGSPMGEGEVYVHSGATGSLLFHFNDPAFHFTKVVPAGDVNADGVPDLVLGAPDTDVSSMTNAGSVLVYSGQDGSQLFRFDGAQAHDRLGVSVSGEEDANGDGVPDFLLGADQADPLNPSGFGTGMALLMSGADGSQLHALSGVALGDGFGRAVSLCGDLDGDASADLLVGAPSGGTGAKAGLGAATLYSGQSGAILHVSEGGRGSGSFGIGVDVVGDIDGDGIADLLIAEPNRSPQGYSSIGAVGVYSGANGSKIHFLEGQVGQYQLGIHVAGLGDLNGDGANEFAVYDPLDPVTGGRTVHVYSGADASIYMQFAGTSRDARFGESLDSISDLNGDGIDEILIGAAGEDPGGLGKVGSAFVFSGGDGSILYQFNGSAVGDEFGKTIRNTGDVDGDGLEDILVAAPRADPGGLTDYGSVFVFSGADGSLLHRIDGQGYAEFLNFSSGSSGDLNQDGFDDIVFGSSSADPNGASDAGSVWAYSGFDGSLLHRIDGEAAYDRFGWPVTVIGDLTGDGFDDIAFRGSPSWEGTVYVHSGRTGAKVAEFLNPNGGNGSFGFSLSPAGDWNLDGYPDLLVSDPSVFVEESAIAGEVYVMSLGPVAPQLELTGTCPGILTVEVAFASPLGSVAMVYGPSGTFVVPNGPCAGLVLDIDSPTLAGYYTADAFGELNMSSPPIPSGFCGQVLQAVDVAKCLASNPATM